MMRAGVCIVVALVAAAALSGELAHASSAAAPAGDDCPVCPVCGDSPEGEGPDTPKRLVRVPAVNFIASYIEPRVEEYNEINKDNVEIRLIEFDGIGRLVEEVLSEAQAGTKLYDGFIIPPLAVGSIDAAGGLKDLTEFVGNDETIRWQDIAIFFRDVAAIYNGKIVSIPLDGDVFLMYYRSDLLEEYGFEVPRTWDEYSEVAKFFNGMEINGTTYVGSCLGRTPGCAGGYWTTAVLASYTQSLGTQQGALVDPATDADFGSLIASPAFEKALENIADQVRGGNVTIELDGLPEGGFCLYTNEAMFLLEQNCVLTYNWGNFFPKAAYEGEGAIDAPPFGMSILPGS